MLETPVTPDIHLDDFDFQKYTPGLKILPLHVPKEVLEKKSRLDKNDNEALDTDIKLEIRENHFAPERPNTLPGNQRTHHRVQSGSFLLESSVSTVTYNQTELVSQTSSFSNTSAVLRGPCDLESEHFLPSQRVKRRKIFCCVG